MKKPLLPPAAWAVATLLTIAVLFWGRHAASQMPRHVQVGDHHLRVSIMGSDGPSVVLETFGGAHLEFWSDLQSRMARFARVMAYDHAGHWGSSPGPKPRHAARIADELHTALQSVGLPAPYVLVGYSFGGPYVRVFASTYPDEVAGLLLVDPTQESFMRMLKERFPEVNAASERDIEDQNERGMQWVSLDQARQAVLPDVPITLITGVKPHDPFTVRYLPEWQAAHAQWLAQHPRSRHILATQSGHGVPVTEPQLIVDALRHLISN